MENITTSALDISLNDSLVTLSIASMLGLLVILLYDDIYPKTLTGKGNDGTEITLGICPQDGFEVQIEFPEDEPMSPSLNPCFKYMAVSGLDRLFILPTIFFRAAVNIKKDTSDQFCGVAGGGHEYCFSPCPSMEGQVFLDWSQVACYVYNNGNPDNPDMLPSEVEEMFTPTIVFPDSLPLPNENRCCGHIGATQTTEMSTYCMAACTDFDMKPIIRDSPPPPCVYFYQGTVMEGIVSTVSSYLEQPVENERIFCPFFLLDAEKFDCTVGMTQCRTDSRGVIQLPPNTESCLVYINGPSAAVGLLAATGVANVVSLGGTVTTAGGLFYMGSLGAPTVCPPLFFCRRGNSCCRLLFSRGRAHCPQSC